MEAGSAALCRRGACLTTCHSIPGRVTRTLSPCKNTVPVNPVENHRSPACPLHGNFLSEAEIRKEGSAAVQRDSGKQPGGCEGRTTRKRDSNADQRGYSLISRGIRVSSHCIRCRSSITAKRKAVLDYEDSSTERSGVILTREGSLGCGSSSSSSEEEEDGRGNSKRCGWERAVGEKPRQLVIVNSCVYDLSDFHHPGGDELLEGRYGTDITEAFEEAGHPATAYKILDNYFVGIVAERLQRYTQQVGGAVCLCAEAASETQRDTSPLSRHAAVDAGSGERTGKKECSSGQRAAQLSTANRYLSDLQAATPELIPTGPDGYPLHPFIDFHRPLTPQIWKLTKQQYIQLTNCYTLTTKVTRLMPYAWMEPFSRTPWWVIPIVWTPWTLLLLRLSYSAHRAAGAGALFVFGICMWTLLEYFLHRFAFHFPETSLPDFGFVRVAHFLLHAVHHLLPFDPQRLVVPPVLMIILTAVIYGGFSLFLPQWLIWGSWPGVTLGYMVYDMVHYAAHHPFYLSRLDFVRKLKKYHMRHHFEFPVGGFGVSSTVWDSIFGTFLPP